MNVGLIEPIVAGKGWGHEKWLCNTDKYCGKLLHFVAGKRCSWHYHPLKDEVFTVLSGKVVLYYSWHDEIQTAYDITLSTGQSFRIPPLLRHQCRAIEDSVIIETSTTHSDDDVVRLIKGD